MPHPSDTGTAPTLAVPAGPSRPALTVDWARYAALIDDPDISAADKQEFLETLWSIMVAFVDLGFGIHPLQQACEQELTLDGLSAAGAEHMLKCSISTESPENETAISPNIDPTPEGADSHV
jgi:hypothetical protein